MILRNRTRDFTTYKKTIDLGSNFNLKTNGMYIPQSGYKGSIFIFYKNGAVKWGNWKNYPCDQIKIDTFEIKEITFLNSREFWGHYSLNNDSITIQVFNHTLEFLYERWIHEFKGIVENDSMFSIYSWYSYYGKDNFIESPIPYCFHSTSFKPDSSKAWFNDKKWFKENLHESRK